MVPVTGELKNRLPTTSKKVNNANKNNTMHANIAEMSTIFFMMFCMKLHCFNNIDFYFRMVYHKIYMKN